MINFKVATLLTAGALSLLGAGVAGAEDAVGVPKVTVRYAAGALDTDSGAKQVYRKIRSAAEEVCGGSVTHGLPTLAMLQCRRQAVDTAVAYIHNTRLAALAARVKAG